MKDENQAHILIQLDFEKEEKSGIGKVVQIFSKNVPNFFVALIQTVLQDLKNLLGGSFGYKYN